MVERIFCVFCKKGHKCSGTRAESKERAEAMSTACAYVGLYGKGSFQKSYGVA